ncbi:MAG: hypothetical protein ACREC6_09090 [Hyphomicrobiaceae bacterium]
MQPIRGPSYLAGIFAVFLFVGSGMTPAAAQQSPLDSRPDAKCGIFFDKRDAKDVPPGTLTMGELLYELLASQDCVDSKNPQMACEHYRRVLKALERDSSLAKEHSAQVKGLMQKFNCS